MRNRRSKKSFSKNFKTFQIIEFSLIILIIFTLIIFIQKMTNLNKQNVNSLEISDVGNNTTNISNEIQSENNISNLTENQPIEPEIADTTFTMAVTGDIMCHNTMYNDAYDSTTKSYDFSYMFEDVKYYLQTADIAVGNLETTFAGSKRGYSSYPTFNTPEILATNLKKTGFDVLSTANNHCMDKGYTGLVSTLNYLDAADISHTGTYATAEDQQQILIKYVKGVSIAFLSFTYGTNGISIPQDKDFCVNLIDKKLILDQLTLAKAQNPDLICVSMHWGIEYQTTPNSTQKDLADFLFENGADIILGNHPHVIQPMEKRSIQLEDGTTKDGFVVYSLGNFMADQRYKYTRDSAILNLEITKSASTGKVSIDSATYTPLYIYKNPSVSKKKFMILDIENTIAAYDAKIDTSIGTTTYNTLVTELKNIKKLLGKEIQ